MALSVGIGSVESVGDTIKMNRFGHVSIDTETVSESVSKDTLMCVEHNLDEHEHHRTTHSLSWLEVMKAFEQPSCSHLCSRSE